MGLIVIYPPDSPSNAVPICMEDRDANGVLINPLWFSRGVTPTHQRICTLASRIVGDRWAASEIADLSVKRIWRTRGNDLGPRPECVVASTAWYIAKDLRAGGDVKNLRNATRLDDLSRRDADMLSVTTDRTDYGREYLKSIEVNNKIDRLLSQVPEGQRAEVEQVIAMLFDGCTWQEIGSAFGRTKDGARIKFHRCIRNITATL